MSGKPNFFDVYAQILKLLGVHRTRQAQNAQVKRQRSLQHTLGSISPNNGLSDLSLCSSCLMVIFSQEVEIEEDNGQVQLKE